MSIKGLRPELWFSVDLEADGDIPGDYSMSSIGIVPVRPDLKDEFYMEFKPISDRFMPEAAAVSGLDRDKLIREGTDPATGIPQLAQWVRSVAKREGGAKPVFCSFGTYDWMFSHWYLVHFAGKDPFGANSLDIKSYAMGALGLEYWQQSRKSLLDKRFLSDKPHTHHGLDDAKEQAEVLWKLLEEVRRRRDG